MNPRHAGPQRRPSGPLALIKPRSLATLIALVGSLGAPPAPGVAAEVIAITTGSTSGVYFKAGEALCRLYRRDLQGNAQGNVQGNAQGNAQGNVQGSAQGNAQVNVAGYVPASAPAGPQGPAPECKALPTNGSVANLILLKKTVHPFAMVQSDVQYQAFAGIGQFADKGRFEELRSLFSLHPETVTILARADAGIRRVEDLAGKRIGNGAPGSGSRLGADQLFDALGYPRARFAMLSPAAPTEAADKLCKRTLDAFILVMGHPADTIALPIEKCGARLVPLTGPAIDSLLRENRYLVRTAIPGGVYAGHAQPIPTYGPLAIVVSTTRVPADLVYRLVRNTFENLNELKGENPSFAELNNWDMISAGLTAPLHDGAIRYYRERGWIK